MYGTTHSAATFGPQSVPVHVEATVERGLPKFTLVGLREADARECRERVRCALRSLGIDLPLARVTVNLSPSDLPKAGAGFDLAVLLAVLAAAGEIPRERVANCASHAELGLDGALRPVPGMLAAVSGFIRRGHAEVLIPQTGPSLPPAIGHCLRLPAVVDVVRRMHGHDTQLIGAGPGPHPDVPTHQEMPSTVDLSDVRGQEHAVRALEIAAAGEHDLLFSGPPGCGKTMLAQRLMTVLPPPSPEEDLEIAVIHDAAGIDRMPGERPFRSPFHGVTSQGLIGGGATRVALGEMTLAHRGVLFLDELPEFRPAAIESLREPMEAGYVSLRRAGWQVRLPARTQVVGAMNLCRCGRHGVDDGPICRCSERERTTYANRVSGAIRSRFDVTVALTPPRGSLLQLARAPSSAAVAQRVCEARSRSHHRMSTRGDVQNRSSGREVATSAARATLSGPAADLVGRATLSMSLSGRSQDALIRVSRTIADLDGSDTVEVDHIAEAITFIPRSGDDE